MSRYSGLAQSIEAAGPALLGGALGIQGVTRGVKGLRTASRALYDNWGLLTSRSRRLARMIRGPLAGAFAVAVPAITAFAEANSDGADTVRDLREELDDTAASTETLTDQWLLSQLESRNLLAEFNNLDIGLGDLRSALLGNSAAYEQLQERVKQQMQVTDHLRGVLYTTSGTTLDFRDDSLRLYDALGDLRSGTRTYNEEVAAQRDLTSKAGDEAKDASGKVDHLGASIDRAAQQAQDFTNALEELTGPAIGVEEAVLGWDSAFSDLNSTLSENEATLARTNKEGRENRQAILGAVDAAQQHATAMIESGASTDEAAATINQHVSQLKKQMAQAGISKSAVSDYIAQLNLTPDQIETAILADTGPAASDVQQFRRDVTSLPPVLADVGADTTPARREIDNLRNFIRSQGLLDFTVSAEAGGPGDGAMPPGGSVISRLNAFLDSTGIPHRTTSTFRPGDDGFHGMGRAVDFAGPTPGRNTPELLAIQRAFVPLAASGVLRELIGPDESMNYKNGMPYPYSQDVQLAHDNHVHTAMAGGGVIREPVFGVGRSGRTYSFGEAGDEQVSPVVSQPAPAGSSVVIQEGAIQVRESRSPRETADAVLAELEDRLAW
jgi:hypothetical protein